MKPFRTVTARLALALSILALMVLAKLPCAYADDSKVVPPEFKKLKFRSIGPAAGGRVCRALGLPGDPRVYYAATASGGVWKSTDAGIRWKPIFDDQPCASIGSIAVATSNPNVVFVGTGEANIRGNVQRGAGIFKSTDAGKTWKHVWKQEGQIGAMIVHPGNPDVAFAAVLGHAFGPNLERGIFRTNDGGKTWKNVLAKNAETGASDVCFDPSNPSILFAGLWQTRRRPWELTSGGPGSGLYTSRDGGDTWKQLAKKGLPEGIWGKVGVAVAPSDGRRVYALIEADKGGLFRSDDGGEKWTLINAGHFLRQRAWYYTTLTIDPKNPDVIWVPQVRLLKSIDGGKTFKKVAGAHHGDHHDIWIDPKNPRRIIDSNDGGVDVTVDGGESWFAPRLPICQFYHVSADTRNPYHVMGNMQDLGSAAGPSNSLNSGGIAFGDWYAVGGGETGFAVPDPSDPDIVYSGEYGGYISRYSHRTRQARNVSIFPFNPSGHGAEDLRYRFQWTAPIAISPHDSKVIYHAANVLFKSSDAGQHWSPISPDLTRNDKSKQKWSGGPITGDNTGAEAYCTIFAIAESPKEKGLLWAGSDDGLVHLSRDGGKSWTDVTKNMTGMPEWGTVTCIEPSHFEGGTAYVVVDAHRLDVMKPFLFKTDDYGKSWSRLSDNLRPGDEYLFVVREDPKRKGLLYAGSERGVFFSLNDGAKWERLKLNLPTAAVVDLVVKNNDLVLGTSGRSLWIFDDLTPIRDSTWRAAEAAATILPVQPAIRWRMASPVYGMKDRYAGSNPANGVSINYFLKTKPKGDVALEIRDAEGTLVNTLSSKKVPDEVAKDDPDAPADASKKTVLTKDAGMNRATWNLQYAGAAKIKNAKIDSGEPDFGPLALPGTYTLSLIVDGKTSAAKATVLPDPRVRAPEAALKEQLAMALKIRADISHLAAMVEQIRTIRAQIASRNQLLKDDPKARPLIPLGEELVKKLDALEAKLHNPKAEVFYDILAQKGGAQLYSQLGYLFETLKDSDGAPTQGLRSTYAGEKKKLSAYEAELRKLVTDDLGRLNTKAREMALPAVIVPGLSGMK
jgi:photosystem II stability/assembly factor-like uncharacterized protein